MRINTLLTTASMLIVPLTAWSQSPPDKAVFPLHVIASINQCLSIDGSTPPVAKVYVKRGDLNDSLEIKVTGIKPGLQFDLFTVQRSPLDASGTPVTGFPGFGLAWYQSDLEADQDGTITLPKPLRSIFLDQIFGFDGDKLPDGTTVLKPTNTFHVGFWFNNPEDAAPCGFDASKPTPFNGEHKAGPLAMISLPDESTGLGPLCTSPSNDATTGNCNP